MIPLPAGIPSRSRTTAAPRRRSSSTSRRGSSSDGDGRLPRASRGRAVEAIARRALEGCRAGWGRGRRRARLRREGSRLGGGCVRRREGLCRGQDRARASAAPAARGRAREALPGARFRHRPLRGLGPVGRCSGRPVGATWRRAQLGPHRPRPGEREPGRQEAGARGLGLRRRRLERRAPARADPRRHVRTETDGRGGGGRGVRRRVRGLLAPGDDGRAGARRERGPVDRGRGRHRRRRARARLARQLQARRGARTGAGRRSSRDPCGGRRGLVPVRHPGRADGEDGVTEALCRLWDLGRDPAQGRDAERGDDRRDQQGSERAHLRVLRPRGGRRPPRDRAEADGARPLPEALTRPADYPPPFGPREYVVAPSDPPEERIDVGVLIVGAGPAGLACAIRLGQLLEANPEMAERLGEVPIAVLEKGKGAGAHLVSGAVVNPRGLRRLFRGSDVRIEDAPSYGPVEHETVYFLTGGTALKIPTPPTMRNDGNFVASLSLLSRWLAEHAEAGGAMILPETAAEKLLMTGARTVGIRTGDKGRGRDGQPLPNFEPGSDVTAKVTVLAEGTQGHLTGVAIDQFGLAGENPQVWALGVKEVWKVARPLDRVIHTLGWPLRGGRKYREFGGSFIYPMGHDMVTLGMVVGLDYRDAELSVHDLLQELKTHRLVRKILHGGERVGWGAKTIPEGGLLAFPRRFHAPGLLLCGDGVGLVNVPALKGIHYAIESGRLAAEAAFGALARGSSMRALASYDASLRESFLWRDLREVRNMRQAFGRGFWMGSAAAGMATVTKGHFPPRDKPTERDADQEVFATARSRSYPAPDGRLTFDKLSSV